MVLKEIITENQESIDSFNKIHRNIQKLKKENGNNPDIQRWDVSVSEVQRRSPNKSMFYASQKDISNLLTIGTGIIRKLTNTTNQN